MFNPEFTYLSPAKLNLFLHITGQRDDGYHNLQTVFQLIDFADEIEILPTKNGQIERVNSLANIPENQDLCLRAARALQAVGGRQAGCQIRVNKRIPMGGGLGGGSSNAATVLLALNQLWQLNLSRAQLMQIGVKLGADVPFFIYGKTAWAEGIGEQFTEISLPNQLYVVLTPNAHASTAALFAHPRLTKNTKPLKIADFLEDAVSASFRNDFQVIVSDLLPPVAQALAFLNQFGQARMTGTGASVFLAVKDEAAAQAVLAKKPNEIAGFVAKSVSQHPLFGYAV